HVHQVSRVVVLVAANISSGGPVLPGEPGHAITRQHPVNGRWVDTQFVADTVRPPSPVHPQGDDTSLAPSGGLLGTVVGPAGAVVHASLALKTEARSPASGGADSDLEPLSSPPVGPTVLDDALSELETTFGGQERVRVGHEDLRYEV